MGDSHLATATDLELIGRSRRWAILVGIASLLTGLVFTVAAVVLPLTATTETGPTPGAVMGVCSLLAAAASAWLGYASVRYAIVGGHCLRRRNDHNLGETLRAQLGVWQAAGAAVVLPLVLLIVLIVLAALAGSAEYSGPLARK